MHRAMFPEPDDSLEALREAARNATYARSLRHVAEQVGMSKEGLRKFLDGSTPTAQTRRKLLVLVRPESVHEEAMEYPPARAALVRAVAHLPAASRAAAVEELRAVVARRSRAAGVPVPRWADDGLGN
ncbi:MAG: hypothetical protein AB1941_12485 [Gemmatimonadota bacterium]